MKTMRWVLLALIFPFLLAGTARAQEVGDPGCYVGVINGMSSTTFLVAWTHEVGDTTLAGRWSHPIEPGGYSTMGVPCENNEHPVVLMIVNAEDPSDYILRELSVPEPGYTHFYCLGARCKQEGPLHIGRGT